MKNVLLGEELEEAEEAQTSPPQLFEGKESMINFNFLFYFQSYQNT